MANGMTIKEVKTRKIKLDEDIMKLVNEFEDETDARISYINLDRKKDQDCKCEEAFDEDRGPVVNINANLNFDF